MFRNVHNLHAIPHVPKGDARGKISKHRMCVCEGNVIPCLINDLICRDKSVWESGHIVCATNHLLVCSCIQDEISYASSHGLLSICKLDRNLAWFQVPKQVPSG